LKNKYLLSVISVVLASLMVSTVTVPVAARVTKSLHKTTFSWAPWEDHWYDWTWTTTFQTSRYEFGTDELVYYEAPLTLTFKEVWSKSSNVGMITSVYFQDPGDGLYFTGMRGTATDDQIDCCTIYQLSGSGVGSYCGHLNAYVVGTIYIVAYWYPPNSEPYVFSQMSFTVTYYA
jgi:hypothetical protein